LVSTMPSTVIGFTNEAAPSIAVMPAGSSRHSATLTDRYWEYIPPPAAATTLPSRARAAADSPAATTVPAPSLPTGMGVPTRPARPRMAASGMGAVTTGRSADPLATAAAISAPPKSRPMSDGLSGAASTLMSTSSGPGSGTGTMSRNSSSIWSALTSDRSWSASAGICADIGAILSERAAQLLVTRHAALREALQTYPCCQQLVALRVMAKISSCPRVRTLSAVRKCAQQGLDAGRRGHVYLGHVFHRH